MSWRERRRKRIISDLADAATVVVQDHRAFELLAISRRETHEQFNMVPKGLCVLAPRLALDTRSAAFSAALDTTAFAIKPIGQGVRVCVVDLTLQPRRPDTYRFEGMRTETQLIPPSADEQRPRNLPPVPRPPKPPVEPAMSLEERLRWILTPPLNELLSDEHFWLPNEPFAYQRYGIWWLTERDSALLADEMGLGKTMQAIIAARILWKRRAIDRILVVCPKPLISTWQEEIRQWWPAAAHNTKVIEDRAQWYLRLGTDNITIKIVNYERLSRLVDWLHEARFAHDLIIIDEAQRIKNPDSRTAQAVTLLTATRRWALTGTPLENKAADVVSIFDFVRPGLLESDEPEYVKTRIEPFMLRRRAEEVLDQLPDKEEHDVPIELGPRQRAAYDRAEDDGVVQLNEQGETITVQHVFALIRKLMQLCNFEPASGDSAKLERIAEDLEEIIDSDKKALIFSQFVSEDFGIKRVARVLPEVCKPSNPLGISQLHGEIKNRDQVRQDFDGDASKQVLLLNYRVGGVGLNLQAANYVFLFDRWWNPAVEDQAVKRAHRIGQKHKVFIRRLYCRDTIEERILQRLREKRRLFAQIIDDDRPTPEMMGLSEEEVFTLFKNLRVRPKRHERRATALRLNLDQLSPKQFETLTGQVYEQQGYKVVDRGGPHDMGVDLEAERRAHIGVERIAIQCKHVKDKVGPDVIRELLGVLAREPRFNSAHLVCSSSFTQAAKGAAFGHRIELIDRTKLVDLVRSYKVADVD